MMIMRFIYLSFYFLEVDLSGVKDILADYELLMDIIMRI